MLTKKFFKTKDEVEVTFEFVRDGVESVALAGDFNDWQPAEMKFNKKAKIFKTKIRLAKNSRFHFRYLLNGSEWENDAKADAYSKNSFGSDNSVVITEA